MVAAGTPVGQVAKALGVTRQTVSEWTADLRKPSADRLAALQEALHEARGKVLTVACDSAENMMRLVVEGAAGCMVQHGGQVEQEPAMVTARGNLAWKALSLVVAPYKPPPDPMPEGDGPFIMWRLPMSPRVPTNDE